MKKSLITIFLLMTAVLLSAGASTLDEIIESAKENSLTYQNNVLTYQNDLLNLASLEEKDKVSVSVEATIDPLYSETKTDSTELDAAIAALITSGTELTKDTYSTLPNVKSEALKGIVMSPKVEVTLPNDGKTTFTGSTSLTTLYKTGETKVTTGLGVSHTFDFTSYPGSKADDLTYTSTKYDTERSNKERELSFEKTVLSTIKSILNAESGLESSKFEVEKQQKAFDKLVALKTYSEESSVYKSTLNRLNSLKSSLEASEEQYNQLLTQYKNLTGLEWDGLDGLTAPTLTLTTYDNGNTTVLLAFLSAEQSEEAYKKAVAEANPSSLSTSISANYDQSSETIKISGGATYNAKNWHVTVSPGLRITTDGDTTPSVTISGKWQNNTSSSDKTVNTALNNAQKAENNYLSALLNYENEANSYALKIIEWNTNLKEAENEKEYQKLLLDNTQALYDLGLETEENLKSAKISYAKSETNYTLTIIEGLSLERDLAIFAL